MLVVQGDKTWRFPDSQIRCWYSNGMIEYQNIHSEFLCKRPRNGQRFVPDNPNNFEEVNGNFFNKNLNLQPIEEPKVDILPEIIKENVIEIEEVIEISDFTDVKFVDCFHNKKYKAKDGISIIIPAHNAQDFIEECLDSIYNNSYIKSINNYEIIIGIDYCEKTKEKLFKIRNKYDKIKIYWFNNNVGPYLVKNTLAIKSKYKILCFFDVDDIMLNNYFEENLTNINENNFVNIQCSNFEHPNIEKINKTYNPHGIILLHREIFFKINGYVNWFCAADTDLINRLINEGYEQIFSKITTMLRRIHSENLTKMKDTGHSSKYRDRKRREIYQRCVSKSKNENYEFYKKIKLV